MANLKFSDRYGYADPRTVFIVESMPKSVVNSICSALDDLKRNLHNIYSQSYSTHTSPNDYFLYGNIERQVWRYFLRNRVSDLKFNYGECREVATAYLQDEKNWWHNKLNLLEFILGVFHAYVTKVDSGYKSVYDTFVNRINADFEDLYYGYHIIGQLVVPITDPIEIDEVEEASQVKQDNVHVHLQAALSHYANRPDPDYRNSIKESISAVECLCREITGESTLDKAIPKMQAKGVQWNSQFEEGLKKLYFYTNDKRTGIRHALMDESNTPTIAEAKYMLVICSAFVNYIRRLLT